MSSPWRGASPPLNPPPPNHPSTPHNLRPARSNAGQPELQIGDKVVAVDGERLNGRYLGKVLASKGDGPYVFTVERGDVAGEALVRRRFGQWPSPRRRP